MYEERSECNSIQVHSVYFVLCSSNIRKAQSYHNVTSAVTLGDPVVFKKAFYSSYNNAKRRREEEKAVDYLTLRTSIPLS